MEAIERRRSVRAYKPDQIPEDVLDKLLRALRLAPSGSNRQPWKFIVVRDPETRAKVASACRFGTPGRPVHVQTWVAEAPVIIVACGDPMEVATGYHEDGEFYLSSGQVVREQLGKSDGECESSLHADLAIALDHLSLVAVEEGLGTCWIAALNEKAIKEHLAVPEGLTARLAMTVGYPVSWPEARPRKSMEEIVCYDRYS